MKSRHRRVGGPYIQSVYEATYWQTVDRLDVVCLISLLVIKETYSNLRVMQNFLDLTSAWWVV